MPYRLKLDEPVVEGVRRIGVAQIDRAAKELARNDRDKGIHEARKSFKRIRALLDASRPALKPKIYRRENRRFRDLGRALAGPRDMHVMRQTLAKLAEQRGLGAAGEVPSALGAWLDAKQMQIGTPDSDAAVARAQEALAEAREAFANLPAKATDITPLIAGLSETYAGGRKAMKRAYRAGADDETFHDWRKNVQRHWRHLQLMRNAWPDVITPRITLASELSKLIGEDHDLSVLIAFVQSNRAILGAPAQVKALIEAARDKQAALRAAAHLRGRRLYALPPGAMARMIQINWEVAPEMRTADTCADRANVVTLAQA
jgi:CHAD domain-containing protein